jgi:hypothetical protein
VIAAAASVIGTVIVPRPSASRLARLVDRVVNGTFQLITRPIRDYYRRDRIRAGPVVLWLG